jgi:hypothetical protein
VYRTRAVLGEALLLHFHALVRQCCALCCDGCHSLGLLAAKNVLTASVEPPLLDPHALTLFVQRSLLLSQLRLADASDCDSI